MADDERQAETEADLKVARERAVMEVLSEWYGHVGLRCVRDVLYALEAIDCAPGPSSRERDYGDAGVG